MNKNNNNSTDTGDNTIDSHGKTSEQNSESTATKAKKQPTVNELQAEDISKKEYPENVKGLV